MEPSEKRICKKCLLQDMPESEYFKNLYEYIEHLDPDIRTEQREYERRLSLCRGCESLMEGMCRLCGCYVELRAAVRKRSCPGTPKWW